ncbi:hypothetical protein GGR51DRAFT_247610 [Nemania sp. FL0031]|nr:hypothetical protein GGR51DRAFT_247610 [Nemania sp. FL0031]
MARPLSQNIFFRLPPAAAALLLSVVFDRTDGHALPRQTKVVQYRELDVIPFPPLPTGQPFSPFDLQLRQENTVCGYLGGNPDIPATCSLGSHCVLDAANSVVGCCPNGVACTTGVFTGCVDRNSDPQTEINPYVFTCQGSDVCFKNNFAGGYYQFGCGTASELGTTVQTSADGATTALSIQTVDVSLTRSPSSLATPTTIGSFASTETTSLSQTSLPSTSATSPSTITSSLSSASSLTSTPSTSIVSTSSASSVTSSRTSSHRTSSNTRSSSLTSTSSTTSTSSSSTRSSTSISPTPTTTESPESARQGQTGAIIGGVVGGAAAAISLVALVFFCLRRRGRNHRTGPGPSPTVPPITHLTPVSHGAAFAPLPSWHEDEGSPSRNFQGHRHPPDIYGPLESTRSPSPNFRTHSNLHPPDPYGPLESTLSAPAPAHGYSQSMRYNPGYMPVGMVQPGGSLTPVVEEDQSLEREESQGREIDDFSHAYSSAGIGQLPDEDTDEDRMPLRNNSHDIHEEEGSPSRRSAGHRPLWQQNRQQNRNLIWL